MPYQKEFFRKDGSRVPVMLVCAFIPDQPGDWMGYALDLSPSVVKSTGAIAATGLFPGAREACTDFITSFRIQRADPNGKSETCLPL